MFHVCQPFSNPVFSSKINFTETLTFCFSLGLCLILVQEVSSIRHQIYKTMYLVAIAVFFMT
jgi:hypothetical protein